MMSMAPENSSTSAALSCDVPFVCYHDDAKNHFDLQPKGQTITLPFLLQQQPYINITSHSSLIFDELRKFRLILKCCALDHCSFTAKFISYLLFIFLTFLIPLLTALFVQIPKSAPADDPICFNQLVQFSESGLALTGFLTLSRFFSQYGLRQLLFLDGLQHDSLYVRRGYTLELDKALRYLASILLPSFLVELAHKIILFSIVKISLPYVGYGYSSVPLNSITFVLVLGSWVYRTGVYLLVCVMFRLTCELQILRFEGLHQMFEGSGSDAHLIFKEHLRIRQQLSGTSHRYRFFIIASLVVITVSQLGALLLVLATKSDKTFFNSGDLVVCSAIELSGFFMCLLGAARITHRAQGIASVATRWHMTATCSAVSSEYHHKTQTDTHDSDSSDTFISISPQEPSSFQARRQALVAYLQHNNGGITLFGFPLDRGLLHTIFAFEFSLVLWILSKAVVLS